MINIYFCQDIYIGMKLCSVKTGEVTIKSIDAPLYFRRRVYSYGLVIGTTIKVKGHGIYFVRGVMLGINKEIAEKIVVEK